MTVRRVSLSNFELFVWNEILLNIWIKWVNWFCFSKWSQNEYRRNLYCIYYYIHVYDINFVYFCHIHAVHTLHMCILLIVVVRLWSISYKVWTCRGEVKDLEVKSLPCRIVSGQLWEWLCHWWVDLTSIKHVNSAI
mgnify:CR=1 FL=1